MGDPCAVGSRFETKWGGSPCGVFPQHGVLECEAHCRGAHAKQNVRCNCGIAEERFAGNWGCIDLGPISPLGYGDLTSSMTCCYVLPSICSSCVVSAFLNMNMISYTGPIQNLVVQLWTFTFA